jgi:hypothetical protein
MAQRTIASCLQKLDRVTGEDSRHAVWLPGDRRMIGESPRNFTYIRRATPALEVLQLPKRDNRRRHISCHYDSWGDEKDPSGPHNRLGCTTNSASARLHRPSVRVHFHHQAICSPSPGSLRHFFPLSLRCEVASRSYRSLTAEAYIYIVLAQGRTFRRRYSSPASNAPAR